MSTLTTLAVWNWSCPRNAYVSPVRRSTTATAIVDGSVLSYARSASVSAEARACRSRTACRDSSAL
jgi:hypothetical protein